MQVDASTRALVTGASRGIGRALALALAQRGATVGALARSQPELETLVRELPHHGRPGRHVALAADVGDGEAVQAKTARFVAAAGGLDLVIANAGIAHYGRFADLPAERAEAMTRVNWLGTLHTVRAGLPHLLAQSHGHVIIVSSGAGLRSFPSAAVYGATKAAQRGFGEALRHELAGTGVGLTVVYPGEIASSLHDHEKASMPAWYRGGPKAVPAERLAAKVIDAIERDARALHHPPFIRLLGLAHGLSPALADRILRRLRGPTAAPRTD